MLIGYFDDSGTHDDSRAVVMAGLIGTEGQWKRFDEAAWAGRLEKPVCGRGPIKRFHMTDCEAGLGEFFEWSRAERDRAIYNFRQVTLDSEVSGYGSAILRKDWDELVTGDIRRFIGDAERYCVTNCIMRSIGWARANSQDLDLALVFDNRPHRTTASERIFKVYQTHCAAYPDQLANVEVSFLSSNSVLPLQGADMVAWEVYRHALNWIEKGRAAQLRPHFKRFVETRRLIAQIADRDAIQKIVAHLGAQQTLVGQLGDYMDPSIAWPIDGSAPPSAA